MSLPSFPYDSDIRNPQSWTFTPSSGSSPGSSYQEVSMPNTTDVEVTPTGGNAAIWAELSGTPGNRTLVVDIVGRNTGDVVSIRPYIASGVWTGIDFIVYNSNGEDLPSVDAFQRTFDGTAADESIIELRFHDGQWNLWGITPRE
jgi:hypothetical protein